MTQSRPFDRWWRVLVVLSVLLPWTDGADARIDVPSTSARRAPTFEINPDGPPPGAAGPSGEAAAMAELNAKARAGDSEAQVRLGAALFGAKPQKIEEALKWFRMSSDGGNAVAAFNLGTIHERGLGVPKDAVQGAKWYRIGADRNNASAQAA